MDGLLIKFFDGPHPSQEPTFWQLLKAIRPALDRRYWCFPWQPWMGPPVGFCDDDCLVDVGDNSTVQLWRPHAIGKYADSFCEEAIELWAIPHACDDKFALVSA